MIVAGGKRWSGRQLRELESNWDETGSDSLEVMLGAYLLFFDELNSDQSVTVFYLEWI